ncbi:hypothetical protein F5Y11DRAFT_81609 [Daldinia sp. FL1419]|nr:hypothetical protein F5Y11DRAFT_81609 [Daldinia sp. FL1419]
MDTSQFLPEPMGEPVAGNEKGCPSSFYSCVRSGCRVHGEQSEKNRLAMTASMAGRYDPKNPGESRERTPTSPSLVFRDVTSGGESGIADSALISSASSLTQVGDNHDVGSVPATVNSNAPDTPSNSSVSLVYPEGFDIPDIHFWKPPERYIQEIVRRNIVPWGNIPDNNDYVDRIFTDEIERRRTIVVTGFQLERAPSGMPPLMFKYGVRYAPNPYSTGVRVSRRVLMTGFPTDTPISDIMARVHGGQVLSVTTAMSPAPVGPTVVVEFKDGVVARAYTEYVRMNKDIVFPGSIQVSLANSHSYPIAPELNRDVENAFTRFLMVLGFVGNDPLEFLDNLNSTFGNPEDILEDLWIDKDALFILFKSVEKASKYYKMALQNQNENIPGIFSGDLCWFVQDPCDKVTSSPHHLQPARYPNSSLLEPWIEKAHRGPDCKGKAKAKEEVLPRRYENHESLGFDRNLLDLSTSGLSSERFPIMEETPKRRREDGMLIDFSLDEEEERSDEIIPKSMLPEDDPDLDELMNRDASLFVRRWDACAILFARSLPRTEIKTLRSSVLARKPGLINNWIQH